MPAGMARLYLIDNSNSNRLKLSLNLVTLNISYFSRMFRLHIQSVKGGHINRVSHETLGKDFGSRLSDSFHFSAFDISVFCNSDSRHQTTQDRCSNQWATSLGWLSLTDFAIYCRVKIFVDSSFNWYLICLSWTTIPTLWGGYIFKSYNNNKPKSPW